MKKEAVANRVIGAGGVVIAMGTPVRNKDNGREFIMSSDILCALDPFNTGKDIVVPHIAPLKG